MRIFSYIVLLLVILLGVTFAILNAQPVTLHYYFGVRTLSLSLLLVLSLGLGVLLGLLVALIPIIKLKSKNYHLKKQIKNH